MSYIDRELLLIGIDRCISSLRVQAKRGQIQEGAIKLVEATRNYIASLSAADVVEVVRCDHCGRRYEEDGEYFCNRTDMPCADDDFCSHGTRMDKETDHEEV